MDINRFKRVIKFSTDNRDMIEKQVKALFSHARMDGNQDVLNLVQIVRPLFADKGFLLVEIPLKDKEIGAFTYKGDAIGYTILNTSLPKVNVNFAMCHELYHVFFQKTEFKQKVELLNEHYYEHEEEFSANLFAGMLLMPEQSFRRMYERFQSEAEEKDTELSTVVKLMSYFEVPYMAALIRCYELELLESGTVLESLMGVSGEEIREEFRRLWLDESILDASKLDNYSRLEQMVSVMGAEFTGRYVNEKTVEKVIQNMRELYKQIKGE